MSSSSSASSGSSNKSSNSSTRTNSLGFLMGYNYSYQFPLGLTLGYYGFYTSWNFNFSVLMDGVSSGSIPDGLTDKTAEMGLEFTLGYSINLYNGIIKLPIGIGMSLTDTYNYYKDNIGNEGWFGNGNMENKDFIIEAGIQFIIIDLLYITSTYRLIGFSKSGFTIGAGFIF